MAIPAQLSAAISLAKTQLALDVIGSRPGQVLAARVVGSGTGGLTQLAVGNRTVEVALPAKLPAGTVVQLRAEGSGPNARLVLSEPAARVAQPAAGQPAARPVQASVQPAAGQPAARPVQAPVPPTSIPLAKTQLALDTPGLRPGQVLAARVVGSGTGGLTQLAVGNRVVEAALPTRLPAGTVVPLRAEGSGLNARLVLADPGIRGAQPTSGQPVTRPVPAAALQPLSPLQAVLTQTAQTMVAKQDSVAVLFSSLAGLGSRVSALPANVAQAAAQVLGVRLDQNARPLNGTTLRQAIARSGVFSENVLSKAASGGAPAADLKSALLSLRTTLSGWLSADPAPLRGKDRPVPPVRGVVPRSLPVETPLLPESASPREAGRALLAQADAALARLRLFQLSSMNDGAARAGTAGQSAAAEWNLELPLLVGSETAILQLQISRDGQGGAQGQDRSWQMRFSLSLETLGEVGAQVSLLADRINVSLWADSEETSALFQEMLDELTEALEAKGLTPGRITCRQGVPAAAHGPAGQFMDDCS